MADQQQFFLKWNDFQSNMVSSFRHLRDEKSFTDVTLACEGQTCKAHKMVLSACSPYFKSLLEVSNTVCTPDLKFHSLDVMQLYCVSHGFFEFFLHFYQSLWLRFIYFGYNVMPQMIHVLEIVNIIF